MQPYITIVQIWKSDTETIPFPVLGVFRDKKAAEDNAAVVTLRMLTEHHPDLINHSVTIAASPLPDASVREFLATLGTYRSDLLHTPRGKVR